jgi:predicted amidohydrolase
MQVAAAQYPITQHASFKDWSFHIENWVKSAVDRGARLLLFPEYGAMELVSLFPEEIRLDIRRQVDKLDEIKDDFCAVFVHLAKKYEVIIVAPSIPLLDQIQHRVNRAFVFAPQGLAGYQDKFFMTRFENEEWGIQSGQKTLSLFETSWGSFGIQICYDVEFGIGSQLLCSAGAELILAPSCTETLRGATRVHVGARARSLENQAYTIVSQTIGESLWSPAVDINYGFAACYSTPDKNFPEEGILSTMKPQKEGWLVQKLDFSKIADVRNDGQVLNFRDQQTLLPFTRDQNISINRVTINF